MNWYKQSSKAWEMSEKAAMDAIKEMMQLGLLPKSISGMHLNYLKRLIRDNINRAFGINYFSAQGQEQ